MDSSIEPIPFGGRDERLELLNMALYLGNLVERAAALGHCDAEAIVDPGGGPSGRPPGAAIRADRRRSAPRSPHLGAPGGSPEVVDPRHSSAWPPRWG